MKRMWLAQALAVIRLELKKTFFAKRGLWIYLLALMPLVLFVGHAIFDHHQSEQRDQIASQSEKPLTFQDLSAITRGMRREEVVQRLGKPPVSDSWDERRKTPGSSQLVAHEKYHYSDGANDLYVQLEDGEVT